MKAGRIFCLFIIAGFVTACASSVPTPISRSGLRPDAPVGHLSLSNNNDERLAALWAARYGKRLEFPFGSGDVLQISVPGLDEFKERSVRVDEHGNVSLPLLGTFRAASLSEDRFREEILKRLGQYMYHPQVDLFVKTFRSRQVSVLGEVHSPAMYTLDGPGDTVREMVQRAGGITDSAAQEILFTPAAPAPGAGASGRAPVQEASLAPAQYSFGADGAGEENSAASLGSSAVDGSLRRAATPTPLVISLVSGSGYKRYLEMPVMPGDTIYIPRAGEVTVVGWVYSPKVISITPGLTVLGAVSASGGTLYAADTSSVKVIRQSPSGRITVLKVDLEKVKEREASDVPVQANDVIEVSYSALRLPGYAVYYAAQAIFSYTPAALVMSGVP